MFVKYIGRIRGKVDVPEIGGFVTPGEPVEVEDDLGNRLLEQPDNWVKVRKQKKVKPDPEVAENATEEDEEGEEE